MCRLRSIDLLFFFFSSRRRHTRCSRDWSSDVCSSDLVATHSRPLDTGVWDNRRERRSPLLGKGGVAAPSSKWSRSFGGADGVVRSTSDNRWLEPTTPSAPAKEASRHFLNGRSHPSLSKEGTSAFPSVVFKCPRVPQKMWDITSLCQG